MRRRSSLAWSISSQAMQSQHTLNPKETTTHDNFRMEEWTGHASTPGWYVMRTWRNTKRGRGRHFDHPQSLAYITTWVSQNTRKVVILCFIFKRLSIHVNKRHMFSGIILYTTHGARLSIIQVKWLKTLEKTDLTSYTHNNMIYTIEQSH